jgi:MFS family permease
MVLDSSVMNVSISQIVADLDTTIQGVQLAITAYTLVMAAFMLVGAKLGDIWGRDRAFAIGLVVYATGSFITSISPNLTVLLFGWSLIEGLGAVLVVPAIAALVAAELRGQGAGAGVRHRRWRRGAAIAAGPVIGGWVTTTWTWRLVFVGEVVIVAVILLVRNRMKSAPAEPNPPSLDIVGAGLSASGLALIVLAILQSSTWGFIQPRVVPVVAGREITPLGFSVVPFMILAGFGLLFLFEAWEQRLARLGRDRLLDSALLGIVHLRAGLATLGAQQLVLLGTFFVLPVYLQVVLGLNALETGLRLLPMSVTMLIAALTGPKIAARRSPKAVCRLGLVAVSLAAVILLATLDVELNDIGFLVGSRSSASGPGSWHPSSERDHLGRATGADERGRRAAGDGPEPRRVARHGAHRRDPADRPDEWVRGPDHANEELPAELRTSIADRCRRAGARGRAGIAGGGLPDRGRPSARPGSGRRGRLRRGATRWPQAGPRRGRAAVAARPVLHAQPARSLHTG